MGEGYGASAHHLPERHGVDAEEAFPTFSETSRPSSASRAARLKLAWATPSGISRTDMAALASAIIVLINSRVKSSAYVVWATFWCYNW